MSDLISRSELLNAMNTWDKFRYDEHNRLIRIDSTNEEYVPYVRYEDMVNCVMNMPTAYDVGKVVADLNNISFLSETRHCENGFPIDNVVLLDTAIKIVKAGCGIDG